MKALPVTEYLAWLLIVKRPETVLKHNELSSTSKCDWIANVLIKWISDTCGFSMSSNFFVPLWESICSTLVYVSLYLPLSSRTSWISTGFKAFEDQPATLVDPSPSFCLCLASPHALPYSELLCPFETSCPCWSDVVYWLPLLLPQHSEAHMAHCLEHQAWLGCTHQQDLVDM